MRGESLAEKDREPRTFRSPLSLLRGDALRIAVAEKESGPLYPPDRIKATATKGIFRVFAKKRGKGGGGGIR